MKSTDRNAVRAGLFIVATVVLTVAVIITIGGADVLLVKQQKRVVQFELKANVGGLRKGDEVRIGGFRAGQIRAVDVVPDEQNRSMVDVTFTMPEKYVIRHGAKVGVESTITGSSVLNFESLGDGKELTTDEVLHGEPGTITRVFENINALAPRIEAIAADIQAKTLPAANATVVKIGSAADEGKLFLVDARGVIGDTKTDIRTTIANLSSATTAMKEKLPAILDNAGASLTNIKDVTASARTVIAGNKGKLQAIVSNIKATSDNLKSTSVEVRHSPWRLLYKPGADEMANLNLFDAARQFADGASELNEASMALRDGAANPQLSKEEVAKLMEKVDKSFTHFKEVEEKLWASVKE